MGATMGISGERKFHRIKGGSWRWKVITDRRMHLSIRDTIKSREATDGSKCASNEVTFHRGDMWVTEDIGHRAYRQYSESRKRGLLGGTEFPEYSLFRNILLLSSVLFSLFNRSWIQSSFYQSLKLHPDLKCNRGRVDPSRTPSS